MTADLPPPPPQNRGLLALVIGMGVLLVLGLILLVLTIVFGWHKRDRAEAAPAASPAAAAGAFEPMVVTTAAGSRLYTLMGDGDRIALHVASESGDEVIVVDTERNRVVSRIRLLPEGGEAGPPPAR